MTLLNESNLASITARIPVLEERYRKLTGKSLLEIGCYASGTTIPSAASLSTLKVASVPVTAGGGLIGNFADIIATIVREFAGVQAWTTKRTDTSGFYDAIEAGADVIFMADDDTCMAYNTRTRVQSHNSDATGRVFAALLELTSGGIDDDVLVLGAGKVGVSAYRFLEEHGVSLRWHDPLLDAPIGMDAACRCPEWSKRTWKYLIDASWAAQFIGSEHLVDDAVVAAPGIPFGLTQAAVDKAKLVIHDELESGVVAMLCEVI
jgi:pyrrolysine biosynthesis protein PylD